MSEGHSGSGVSTAPEFPGAWARWKRACRMSTALAAVTVLAAGCGSPSIDAFNVTPLRTCSNRPISVSWKASGTTTLRVTPETADDGHGALGKKARALRFTLFARSGGKEEHREKDAHVFDSGARIPLTFPVDIKGNRLEADRKINAGRWSDAVHIVQVGADWSGAGSTTPRAIHVRHAARSATLSTDINKASDKLAGTAVGGEWELDAPLLDGETHPPKQFHVYITVACNP